VIDAWLAALERRHLADLTTGELTRALRALSSCYVERRGKLVEGAALEGAGKRAAFALFYGPLHFLTVSEIVRALKADVHPPGTIVDLGCGTGVAGAAWALACGARPRVMGIDRSAWAVAEANWTYDALSIRGSARRGHIAQSTFESSPFTTPAPNLRPPTSTLRSPASTLHPPPSTLLAYALNELPDDTRASLLDTLVSAPSRPVLIVEAIAKRDKPWWPRWVERLGAVGGRADEWRFPVQLPATLRRIAVSAGLASDTLTARTLWRP
jgi:Methyltransferase small domain